MLLLAIMPIQGEYQEKLLHNHLKIKCPYCIMNHKYPDGTNATELYKLHPNLIKEFYFYIKQLELDNKNKETKQLEYIEKTKLEQEKTKQEQEKTKQEQEKTKQEQEKTKQEQEKTKQIEYIEKTKQIEYIEKTKQEQEKTKQLEIQLEILKIKKNK